MLNIGRHFLKKQQREELQRLREEQPKREKPLPRFVTWLDGRNRRARLLLRYRRRAELSPDVKTFEFPRISDMASPYTAYRELLLSKSPEKIDESRLDAMIALRMRLAGYTRGEVGNEIYRKAQELRRKTEHRDWRDYASRATIYAFGAAGHIDIMNFNPTPEKILAFHQEAEKLEAARTGETETPRETLRLRMR